LIKIILRIKKKESNIKKKGKVIHMSEKNKWKKEEKCKKLNEKKSKKCKK
jgi:hypothetical protein